MDDPDRVLLLEQSKEMYVSELSENEREDNFNIDGVEIVNHAVVDERFRSLCQGKSIQVKIQPRVADVLELCPLLLLVRLFASTSHGSN